MTALDWLEEKLFQTISHDNIWSHIQRLVQVTVFLYSIISTIFVSATTAVCDSAVSCFYASYHIVFTFSHARTTIIFLDCAVRIEKPNWQCRHIGSRAKLPWNHFPPNNS